MSLSSFSSLGGTLSTALLSVGIGVTASGLISTATTPATVYVEQPIVEVAASPDVTYLPGPTLDPRVIAILPATPAVAAVTTGSTEAPLITPSDPLAPLPTISGDDAAGGDDENHDADEGGEDEDSESGDDD